MTEVLGQRVCSSILPWRSCRSREPWVGTNTYERTVEAVDAVSRSVPTVWGGDWNHALKGREYAGSKAWDARVEHHPALLAEGRLSDHDAHVFEVVGP